LGIASCSFSRAVASACRARSWRSRTLCSLPQSLQSFAVTLKIIMAHKKNPKPSNSPSISLPTPSCALNPFTGRWDSFSISPRSDKSTPAISAPQHQNQFGRDEYSALSALQRRAETAHRRNLAKASGEISFHCETCRDRLSARFLHVQGTARCTDRCRYQSRPSPSFNDEEGHAEVQRKIPSQRFDRLRRRHSSRHRGTSMSVFAPRS
jgi:hypothetical protein